MQATVFFGKGGRAFLLLFPGKKDIMTLLWIRLGPGGMHSEAYREQRIPVFMDYLPADAASQEEK